MKKRLKPIFASFMFISSSCWAGGLYLYEIGTEDVGLANAGIAARAQDASVIANNPAGMTRLDGKQITTGAQLLYGDVRYKLNGNGANPDKSVVGYFPALSSFYSHSVNNRLKVGLGMYGNFGLGLHYGDWAGSTLIKDTLLTAITIQPSVAYKINDKFSLGAGLGINYGLFSLKRNTANGEDKLNDHDWALNAKLGLLYEPTPDTRLGLAYTSKTDYNYDVTARAQLSYSVPNPIPNRPPIEISKDIVLPLNGSVNTPQQLMFSAYHQLNPKWALLANIGWQDWSAYSNSQIKVADTPLASKERLHDTWHTAFGVQHQVDNNLRLNAGIAYDSSFYKSQSNTALTMPSGASWRIGTGAQYQISPASSVGAAFEYLRSQGASVNSKVLSGSYDPMKLYFLTLNYSHKF